MADEKAAGLVAAETEQPLSGEPLGFAGADHAAGSRSRAGSVDLLTLSQRVEEAAGPSRELDAEIGVSIGRFFVCEPRYPGESSPRYGYIDNDGSRVEPGQAGDMLVPRYTASIDAAMTLVPKGLMWTMDSWSQSQWSAGIWRHQTGWIINSDVDHQSRTPALALCAAALRARSSQENG